MFEPVDFHRTAEVRNFSEVSHKPASFFLPQPDMSIYLL